MRRPFLSIIFVRALLLGRLIYFWGFTPLKKLKWETFSEILITFLIFVRAVVLCYFMFTLIHMQVSNYMFTDIFLFDFKKRSPLLNQVCKLACTAYKFVHKEGTGASIIVKIHVINWQHIPVVFGAINTIIGLVLTAIEIDTSGVGTESLETIFLRDFPARLKSRFEETYSRTTVSVTPCKQISCPDEVVEF